MKCLGSSLPKRAGSEAVLNTFWQKLANQITVNLFKNQEWFLKLFSTSKLKFLGIAGNLYFHCVVRIKQNNSFC